MVRPYELRKQTKHTPLIRNTSTRGYCRRISLIFLLLSFRIAAGLSVPLSQLYALQFLYNTTNGIEWKWKNEALSGPRWSFTSLDIQPDPCNDNNKRWQGIICSSSPSVCRIQECSIVSLVLSNYGLSGTLPYETFFYSALTSLTTLELTSSVDLIGTLPPSLGSLTNLEILSFSSNGLSGIIPSSVSKLPRLKSFDLLNNHLNGTIPSLWGSYLISRLYLGYNQLTGSIPSELGRILSLQELYLDYNLLSDTIPLELDLLHNLTVLSLIGNKLSGSIPPLSKLSSLQELSLDRNLLSGSIPSQIGQLINLTQLSLSLNELSGSIPNKIESLTRLNILYLNYNQLDGSIPSSLSSLENLIVLSLFSNFLTHTIPPELSQLSKVSIFYIQSNFLSGSIPSELSLLNQTLSLSLSVNHLTGLIPSDLVKLQSLRELYLDSNGFTGTLPIEVGNFAQLSAFTLGNNQLSGTIPNNLSNISTLSSIFLNYNYFSGPIPLNLIEHPNLAFLFLDHNQLTGEISSLETPNHFQVLDLSFNMISGSIPSAIGLITTLEELHLAHNYFTGTIPASIMNLTNLFSLHLYQNHLSGEIQLRLEELPLLQQLFLQQNHLVGHLDGLTMYGDESVLASSVVINLDVSDNLFSGSVPSTLFLLPHLQSISLSLNCFEGELPISICESKEVEVISLDGLGSADGCENRVMIPFTSVSLGHRLDGSIPDCVWLLSNLKMLNLAGNGLSGTIGSISSMSSLLSMTLSHNYLGGVIPSWLQEKNMSLLDLSHNKLTGDVDGFKYQVDELNADVLNSTYGLLSADRTLKLSVNRLSGDLYTSFSKYASLDILSGNLFSCKYTPTVDKNSEWTSCGSEEYDRSMSVMVGVLGVLLIFVLFYCLCLVISIYQQNLTSGPRQLSGDPSYPQTTSLDTEKSDISKDLQTASGTRSTIAGRRDWMEMILIDYHKLMEYVRYYSIGSSRLIRAYSEDSLRSVMLFGLVLSRFIRWLWVLLIVSLVLSLPIYIMKELNVGYDETHEDDTGIATHYHMYRWLWTMAFISGKLPAMLLMLMTCVSLMLFLFILFLLSRLQLNSSPPQNTLNTPQPFSLNNIPKTLIVWFVFVTNIAVIGTANGLYIWSTLSNISTDARSGIQISFVIFSFVWSFLLRQAIPTITQESKHRVWLFIYLNLINHIAIPCIVTSLSSPSCYQRVIVPPDKISSSYIYQHCEIWTSHLLECVLPVPMIMDVVKFSPPFSYSYQCGSTLLVSYLPVYLYSISMSIMFIALKVALIFTSNLVTLPEWIITLLSKLHWPLLSSNQFQKKIMIEPSQIISNAMNNVLLFLTFGLCSPVLAFSIVLNITINLCSWLLLIGRFLFLRILMSSENREEIDINLCNPIHNDAVRENHLSPQIHSTVNDEFVTLLNGQVQGVQSYLLVCKWPVVYTSCFFMTLLCWEIAGDEIGWFDALWVPIGGVLMLLLVIAWDMLLNMKNFRLLSIFAFSSASLSSRRSSIINISESESSKENISPTQHAVELRSTIDSMN